MTACHCILVFKSKIIFAHKVHSEHILSKGNSIYQNVDRITEEAVSCKASGLETGQEGVSTDSRKMTSLLTPHTARPGGCS